MSALAFAIRYLEEVVWNYDLAGNRACFRVVLATLDGIQSGARQPIPGHGSFMDAAVRAAVHDELEALQSAIEHVIHACSEFCLDSTVCQLRISAVAQAKRLIEETLT